MQTCGIKINISSSDKLLFDEREKIQKAIKFAVKQAVLQKDKKTKPKNSEKNLNKHYG